MMNKSSLEENPMTKASFKMGFDGPAVETNEIGVKELAPALLSLADAIEEANRLINGNRARIAVNIKATREGSFLVDLVANQDILAQAVGLFDSHGINAIVNAKELLGLLGLGGGGGYLGVTHFIKWLRGRKLRNVKVLKDGSTTITTEDGDEVIISKHWVIELFRSIKIRKDIEATIRKPLLTGGIEKVYFRTDEGESTVNKNEADWFSAPEGEDTKLGTNEYKATLQFVDINFTEGGKWRFTDGDSTFFAEMLDQDFLLRVNSNIEVFAKGDLLTVQMRTHQFLNQSGRLVSQHEIIRVLEHKSAAIQAEIPLEKADE